MDITPQTAADSLGCRVRTVQRMCLEHGIGRLLHNRQRLLSRADVRRLRTILAERVRGGERAGSGRKAEGKPVRQVKVDKRKRPKA